MTNQPVLTVVPSTSDDVNTLTRTLAVAPNPLTAKQIRAQTGWTYHRFWKALTWLRAYGTLSERDDPKDCRIRLYALRTPNRSKN